MLYEYMIISLLLACCMFFVFFFFFNDTATTEIYTLSLHDALPIWAAPAIGPRLRDFECPLRQAVGGRGGALWRPARAGRRLVGRSVSRDRSPGIRLGGNVGSFHDAVARAVRREPGRLRRVRPAG